jgi:predicted RNA-binding Zn-ribbon protein involved in translation (DUF1610 family)
MSDSTRDLLVRGIAAAKSGDPKEAQFYLEWVLRLEPPLHQKIDAWYWLSECITDAHTQREYLELILIHDPSEGRARRKLAILDGKLREDDIIDPDRIDRSTGIQPRSSAIEGFACPQCGGRMTYAADGQSLACEFCETQQRLAKATGSQSSVRESDFHIALATRRGHINPIWAHSINCSGCGALLILEAGQVSHACPYCITPYALEQIQDVEIVPPDGILPLELTHDQAIKQIANWLETEVPDSACKVTTAELIYLPAWTFDVGGQVTWNCKVKKDRQWVSLDGLEIVYHNDMPVFATRQLSQELHAALSGFDFGKMVDFDRRYLAGVKAENYQISAGDASLVARKIAIDTQRQAILRRLSEQVSAFRIDSSKIIVEAFRLVFVPGCLVQYEAAGERFQALVNGQTGAVHAQKPAVTKKSFLSSLFS